MGSQKRQGRSGAGSSRRVMGVFVLAMINVAAVLSLRNFPSMAEYGWQSIFWIMLGTLLFLLPLALAGAELASMLPESTGVYDWVREGLGQSSGFVGIWSEWIENVVWFPTALSFLSATLAFAITSSLAANKLFMFTTMIGIFWIVTLVNFLGDRWSGAISTFGTIVGSIVPGIVIVALGVGWIIAGEPVQIHIDGVASFFPSSFDLSTMALVATVVLLFAGLEMAGYHALETRNPQRDFPRAMFISAAVICLITVLGTLAISFVIPVSDIDLVSGVMQAFTDFFNRLGVSWAVRPMAILVFVGGIALLSTWIIGPAKGLHGPTRDGLLPPMWAKENTRGVPVGVIVLQGVLATLFSSAFLLVPGVSGAYWILSALTAQILAVMYFLIFMSVIRLRYLKPGAKRPYRIPGGTVGVWVVGGVGALSVLFTFVVGFFPPSQITTLSPGIYPFVILGGVLLLSLPPFIFYKLRKPSWLESGQSSIRFRETIQDGEPSPSTSP